MAKNLPFVMGAKENADNCIKEVIVVDDGSKDDSVVFLKKNFPEVSLVKHKVNRGFSAAVNTGVRYSSGDLVVLINSDVAPDPDFLSHNLKLFQDKKVFAVNLHTKGYGPVRGYFGEGFILYKDIPESEKITPTFFANAGGSIYRRDLWIKLGGMDESLFSPFYWEDVDLSYRALKR